MTRTLLIAILLVMASSCALAQSIIPPVAQFTIRDGRQLDAGGGGIIGSVQEGPTTEDESFFEFDLSGIGEVSTATIKFSVYNYPSRPNVAHTFDVSHYSGSGAPSLARFHSGTLLTTLGIEAPTSSMAVFKTFSLDVKPLIASYLATNSTNLGFRRHDPVKSGPSDHVPFLVYRADTASLLINVPEPSVATLLSNAALAVGQLRRRYRRRPL